MKTTNKGRKSVIYDEDLILGIIYDCKSKWKIKGKIPYSKVTEYTKRNLTKYPFIKGTLSEDYWRKIGRQGRELVDRVNDVETMPLVGDSNSVIDESETFTNTADTVNKLFTGSEKNKKLLIDSLRINEVKARNFYKKNKRLYQDLNIEREKMQVWKKKANRLQTILFQIMEYSASKNFPIENLINTGATRTSPVNKILDTVFSDDPTIGFDFEQYYEDKVKTKENVVSMKKKRSAADDFGLL